MIQQEKQQSTWLMIGMFLAVSAYAFYTLWSKTGG